MESIKRVLAIVVVAGMISLGVFGCGADDENGGVQQETGRTAPAQQQAAEDANEQARPAEQLGTQTQAEPDTGQQAPDDKQELQDQDQTPAEPVDMGPTRVRLETTKGDIVIELYDDAAPITVANFMRYVLDDAYDGTIFHRVIPNFMIQGGGFTPDMERTPMNAPIKNEASNNLANKRGTVAMARTSDPDSATNQFFINLVDNKQLNYGGPGQPGYAVFGRVVEGMDVVDAIAQVPTETQGDFQDVPVEPVVIKKAEIAGAAVAGQQEEDAAAEQQQTPQN